MNNSENETGLSSIYTRRQYSLVQLTTQLVRGGYVENPDTVSKQFGAHGGIKVYLRMMREDPSILAPVSQRIDPVIEAERQIIPGDANDDMSVAMAAEQTRVFRDIKSKEMVQRHALMGQFLGHGPVEKVYGIHEATGLIAPVGENGDGHGLFIIPVENLKYGPNGEELVVTSRHFRGMLVPPGKLMIFRWGTNATPYGEGEFQYIYLATWYKKIIVDYGMKALELLGRPIPVLYVPRSAPNSKLVDEAEKAIASQFDFYVMLPTDEKKPHTELLGGNVAASGSAGRAEQEWARYFDNAIWNGLVNTSQTQDRGGQGNGKLEEQRAVVKSGKVAAASDALDSWWTEGFCDDISQRNWGNQPRQLWPRCKSDITEVSLQGLTGSAASTADTVLRRYIAKQCTAEHVEEVVTGLGLPRSRVLRVIESIDKNRDALAISADIVKDLGLAAPVQTSGKSEREQEAAA